MAAEPPQRVLLIGNSFVLYNGGLHAILENQLETSHPTVVVRHVAVPDAHLADHFEKKPEVLVNRGWDIAVVQGYSDEPVNPRKRPAFLRSARQLHQRLSAANVGMVLMMTWAYTGRPAMTGALDRAYSDLGRELGVAVAPVGLAFARFAAIAPDIRLRLADGKHPTPIGSYLAASVLHETLFGPLPVDGGTAAGLDPGLSRLAREVAAATVAAYRAREAAQTSSR